MCSIVFLLSILVIFAGQPIGCAKRPPHIILIVADDLGWNDVSFHGSKQIPTPNIDSLANDGIILNNYYVQPICTPSRSALLTGMHPIKTGMQHGVITGASPYGLPLKFKLMPQHLQNLGYRTHIVGKWHLGFFRNEYTPLYRGFESHFGYWSGHQDYYDHMAEEFQYWGYDMRKNMSVAWDAFGKYSTELFTEHALKVIENHDATKEPLFLYLAHLAVHSANTYSPLQAAKKYTSRFPWIKDKKRRTFAGMLAALDDGVGDVIEAFLHKGMLQDCVIAFTTDNGGPAAGFDMNYASNWPLRGVKATLWEGGVRGAGFLWSTYLNKSSRTSHQLMKIEDWLPTLYSAAGGNVKDLGYIDGTDMWGILSDDLPSPQHEILHNIDDLSNTSAIRVGDWKLIQGNAYGRKWNGWYGPSGRNVTYQPKAPTTISTNSKVNIALSKVRGPRWKPLGEFRKDSEVVCGEKPENMTCFVWKKPCLFNIANDPCEYHNLAHESRHIVRELLTKIEGYRRSAVPAGNQPFDPSANPIFHGGAWVPWKR